MAGAIFSGGNSMVIYYKLSVLLLKYNSHLFFIFTGQLITITNVPNYIARCYGSSKQNLLFIFVKLDKWEIYAVDSELDIWIMVGACRPLTESWTFASESINPTNYSASHNGILVRKNSIMLTKASGEVFDKAVIFMLLISFLDFSLFFLETQNPQSFVVFSIKCHLKLLFISVIHLQYFGQ